MLDKELLDILACPETKEPVRLADRSVIDAVNDRIEQGKVRTRGGKRVEKKIDAGLIRADGAYLYPVEDDIPIMLVDEAIALR